MAGVDNIYPTSRTHSDTRNANAEKDVLIHTPGKRIGDGWSRLREISLEYG